jgi:hypothetical protein
MMDAYFDPELECGHTAASECDCWCDGGEGGPHLEGHCTGENCSYLQCESCAKPVDDDYEVEHIVKNLQRRNGNGDPMWVDAEQTKPLRFIPQNQLSVARICNSCKEEYDYEIETKELIQ